MSVFMFTHDDLDAVGSVVMAHYLFEKIEKVEYHQYTTIDEAITKFINEKNFTITDLLLITDICPTEPVCEKINEIVNKEIKVCLLDHHHTRNFVTKFPWAKNDNEKCGTLLMYYEDARWVDFKNQGAFDFARTIDAWDRWLIKSPYRARSEKLNSLLGFIGKKDFVDFFTKNIEADLCEPLKTIIDYAEKRKAKYVKEISTATRNEATVYLDGYNQKFQIAFAKEFLSEIGNKILEENEDIDYVVIANPHNNQCSIRSRSDIVDVSKLAKQFGGGGHKTASGFPLNMQEGIRSNIVNRLNRINL